MNLAKTSTDAGDLPEGAGSSLSPAFAIALGIVAVLFAIAFWAQGQIPPNAHIPVHWNAAGQPDRFGGPKSLFLFPWVALGVALLFRLLPHIEPRRAHLLQSSRAYRTVWLALMAFLAGMDVLTVRAALGLSAPMSLFVSLGLGLLLFVVGLVLRNIQSNFIFGVRTPWTLSSELSWSRTHRLAGWLFAALGLAIAATSVIPFPRAWFGVGLVASVIAVTLTVTAYSYFVWRSDPEKIVPH